MVGRFQLILTVVLILIVAPHSHGQLFSNEDSPSLLDKILQVVWEPSSLIRVWVGLDQLYNIALSWRTVAKKLASLPFGEERSMDHVKIQEPRSLKYHKPSVASQWDRFNKIYSSSHLSPIVADTRSRLTYDQQPDKFLENSLQTAEDYSHPKIFKVDQNPKAAFGLPPPFHFFQTQDQLLNSGGDTMVDLLKSANELEQSLPFENYPEAVSRLLEMQRRENQQMLQNKRFPYQFAGIGSPVPQQVSHTGGVLSGGPQERLNMFLKLLKSIGNMHENDIRRESSDSNDR